MIWFLLFILSCLSENLLTRSVKDVEVQEVVVEKEVIVEKEVPVPLIIEKEVEVLVEDTGQDAADIWVEHFIQPVSVNGVDILWVIDPSGSMNNDAPQILAGINDMMNALPAVGWRLAIIPSDYRFSEQVAEFPLLPGDTPAMAQAMYNNVVAGAYEAGFDAAYGYIMNSSYAQTWLRPDAAMLIVFVSDEDEQSQVYFNSTSQFVSWYSGYRSNVWMASIINLDPSVSQCAVANPQHTGHEYMAATNHFNGQVIDICDPDWASGVLDASNQVAPHEYWELSMTPIYNDRIYVFIDGQSVPATNGSNTNWRYVPAENRVYFDSIPAGGSLVEIAYYYQ